MLGDSTIRESTEEHIRRERCNAEWALQTQLEQVMTEFRNLDDDYIRTRGEDITQVVRLVQHGGREASGLEPVVDALSVERVDTPGGVADEHPVGTGDPRHRPAHGQQGRPGRP